MESEQSKISSGVKANDQFGHYKIISRIGKGGMGEVFLAKDKTLDRKVALKFLNEKFSHDTDKLNRFIQEAKAASALNHPNILTVFEIGETDGAKYMAAEFIEGQTLRDLIENKELIALNTVLKITIQIAEALSAAHEADIIHRDIKPENVMIRQDGYVKVLDFGIAKVLENRVTNTDLEAETLQAINTDPGTIMGTIAYMSPEQARGLRVDFRTDIWSLGVVLYEMITGKLPFYGLTSSDVMAAILRAEPPPISRFTAKTYSGIQRIINKCLSKETVKRYQEINDVLLVLKGLQKKKEIGASLERVAENKDTKVIAILPFRNLASDNSVDFYEFSLADAVITELARLRSLVVRPSSAIAKYRGKEFDPNEVGRELEVHAILSAGFLCSGKKMRVTAQLLNVMSGDILWSDRIDAESDDILALQDKIVPRILDGLRLELSTDEQEVLSRNPTTNADAYEEYLRGRDNFARFVFRTVADKDCEAAIANFKGAIELDPEFALAYSGLGACYANRKMKGMGSARDYDYAEEAFSIALQYDPNIVEAGVLMIFVYLSRGQKIKAREKLKNLEENFPNESPIYFIKATMHRLNGEYEESLKAWEKIESLDPNSRVVASYNRARIFLYQNKCEKALSELNRAALIAPNHLMVRFFYAVAVFRSGDPAKAAELLSDLYKEDSKDFIRIYLAVCLSALGRHEEARKQITDDVKSIAAADHDISYWLATAYVMEKQYEEALEWLGFSIDLGNDNLPWLKTNPSWQPLHDNSEFEHYLRKVEANRSK